MKKILIFIFVFSIAAMSFAQTESTTMSANDSIPVDTLSPNLIGLNVFPAFGILGGGRLPSTKIFIQYKHMYEKMNLRASVNYLSFYVDNDKIDLLRLDRDTLIKDYVDPITSVVTPNGDTIVADSLVFRKFYYDIYSYDARIGLEAAFPGKGYRFYVGAGLIGGYHYVGEFYYHYRREFKGYPVEYTNLSTMDIETTGFRKTSFLKTGVDFTIGVDINISPNCVVSVQYAPELIYYYKLKQDVIDPDNYFTRELSDGFAFVPDYIDFVVNIRF